MIKVIADDRERGSGVIEALQGISGVTVEVRRLGLGDYMIDGALLFERKTFHDFAASIIDGRLFSQAHRLAGYGGFSVFILEGGTTDLAAIGLTREAMQGALISLSLSFGLPVLRSMDVRESARVMMYAALQRQKQSRRPVSRGGYRPRTKRKRQLYLLQAFSGIGPEKAGRLIDHFGSIRAVVGAGYKELMNVPGIGYRISKSISDLVKEVRGQYNAE